MKEYKAHKACEHCGCDADPVYTYVDAPVGGRLAGWYCLACGHWDRAVGRERSFKQGEQDAVRSH